MNKLFFIAAVAASLTACGGSTTDQQAPAPKMLVLGNAISYEDVQANRGWNHASGMAASDSGHDFAHVAATQAKVGVEVQNISSLEVDPINTGGFIDYQVSQATDENTIVVVQLGDEVNPDHRDVFRTEYTRLLNAVSLHRKLICVSTWVQDPELDGWMNAACVAHGGTWVNIGDVYPTRTDVIPSGQDAAIAMRPHDPSMLIIGQRIANAAK